MSSTKERRMAIDRRLASLAEEIGVERQERERQNAADDEQFEALDERIAAVEDEQVRQHHRLRWLEKRVGRPRRKRVNRARKTAR